MKTNLCKRIMSASMSAVLALSAFASAGVTAGAYSGETTDQMWKITIGDVNKQYRDAFDLFTKINEKRQEAGLNALVMVEDWCDESFVRAAELPLLQSTVALNDEMYDYRADSSTAIGSYYREAIAVGNLTNAQIVDQLFTSQEYSYVMKSTLAKEIGVGVVTVHGDTDTKFVCVRMTDEKNYAGLTYTQVTQSDYDKDDELTTVDTVACSENLRFDDPYDDYTLYVGYPERIEFKATELNGKGTYAYILPHVAVSSSQTYISKVGNDITPLSPTDSLRIIVRLNAADSNSSSYGGSRYWKVVDGVPPEEEELDDLNIQAIPDQRYTGEAINPEIVVFDKNRTTLTMGIHYYASITNNVNVGTANVEVIGMGTYAGKSASTTFQIVEMPDPLELSVNVSDAAPTVGDAVTITATAAGGTAPYKYTYEYKKQSDAAYTMIAFESSSATASFPTRTVGEYVLQVTLSDAAGQTAVQTVNVSVTEALTVSLSASPDHLFTGDAVTVTATAAGGKEPYTYSFRHADADEAYYTGVMDHYVLRPQTTGTVTDIVTVTDANGKTAQAQSQYVIGGALSVTATLSKERINANDTATVTAQASGGFAPYTYTYRFGLTTGTMTTLAEDTAETSVTLAPTAPGTYRVEVTAKDSADYTKTENKYLTVLEPMVVTLTPASESVFLGDSITFTGKVEGGTSPYSYTFTYKAFESGSVVEKTVSRSTPSITLKPYEVGTFTVTMTAVDQLGSSQSATASVTVSDELVGTLTVSPKVSIKGGEVLAAVEAEGGIGDRTYSYYVRTAGTAGNYTLVASGSQTSCALPTNAVGEFEVKVVVEDASAHTLTLTDEYVVAEDITISNLTVDYPDSYSYPYAMTGDTVEVYMELSGGSGSYSVELFQGNESVASGSTDTDRISLTFVPTTEGQFTLKAVVTDTYDITKEATASLQVKKGLTNTSTVSAPYPYVGEAIILNGSAEGGHTKDGFSYLYAYKVKAPGAEEYQVLEMEGKVSGFYPGTSVEYVPEATGVYTFSIDVRDSAYQIRTVTFTVEVTEPSNITYNVKINNKEPIVGSTVKVKVTASGGIGQLTTQVMYRRVEIGKAWNHLENDETGTAASFIPGLPVEYTVKVVVSDERGHELKKYYTVTAQAAPPLVNTSEVSVEEAMIGDRIEITGKAEGGRGNYTFDYSYKKTGSTAWTPIPTVSEDTKTASFIARAAATYFIRIQVTDENGRSKTIVRSVVVSEVPELTNVSYCDDLMVKGQPCQITPAAEGGKGEYTYTVFVKKNSGTFWTKIEPANGAYFFTPAYLTEYDIKVIVKDSRGVSAVKLWTVGVAEEAS